MGRGSSDKANSARYLLYGRSRRPVSPEAAARARKAKRKVDIEQAKRGLARSWELAGQALADGNGQPLIELVNNPAGHGLKGTEKESIRAFIDPALEICRSAINPDLDTKPLDRVEEIAAFLDLSGRVTDVRLPRQAFKQCEMTTSLYAQHLANRQIIDQLERDRSQIGPLPQATFGDDFCEHLTNQSGDPLCGEARYPRAIAPQQMKFNSILEAEIDCNDCRKIYRSDINKAVLLTPDQWLEQLRQSQLGHWSSITVRKLSYTSGDNPTRVEKIIDEYKQMAADSIDHYLELFSDYSASKSLS